MVPEELFDKMKCWAPRHLPIFDLVPPAFRRQITAFYSSLGCPAVLSNNFWAICIELVNSFQTLWLLPPIAEALGMADLGAEEHVPLLSGLWDLQFGDDAVGKLGYVYYGGLTNPSPLPTERDEEEEEEVEYGLKPEYADFSD